MIAAAPYYHETPFDTDSESHDWEFDPSTPESELWNHLVMLQSAAKKVPEGILVIASFGQDLKTAKAIPSKIEHFEIGDTEGMYEAALRLGKEQYRNVYAPLAVFKPLRPKQKGREEDIVAVLGFCADFDDAAAEKWPKRLPRPPDAVLQTSLGRFQAFYIFETPAARAAAKPVAARLCAFAQCDTGTRDMSHVWRLPGLLNWPSATKVRIGRDPEPQRVKTVQMWTGTFTP